MTYHLRYWGSVQNERWIARELGITAEDLFFETAAERTIMRARLKAVAAAHDCIIVFSEHEGPTALLRTVASMRLVLPNGDRVRFRYDFGYGYEVGSAEFMFRQGNYACDCNLSLFLARLGYPIEELDCGNAIAVEDFHVLREEQ